MRTSEVREAFIQYFERNGHTRVHSSSLIPPTDPTLLFTNSGMVQFKDCLLGTELRDYNRATSAQRCMRVSGKHNDLETVGRTARHHTFFEMLGNFSFGDYFKQKAIAFGWEFLVDVCGLDPDRMWITIFREDDEAFELWQNTVGVPAERIVRMDEEDNFWAMGDTGPCGPCSELIYDQGPEVWGGPPGCGGPEEQGDRFLELWNLVFMQYDRDASGNLNPLPAPSIDTGMGLERLAAVIQGKVSNYDIDLLRPIIGWVEELAGREYGADPTSDVSFRVVADHVRATTFMVADGILPSNVGRGYVLRQILRRGARHGKLLGIEAPFLHRGVGLVVDLMKDAYPEVVQAENYAARVILHEEERFSSTLQYGIRVLDEEIERIKEASETTLPGTVAFKLHDTYGFPLDLTRDICEDKGLGLDESGFHSAMEEQRAKARASWKGTGVEAVKAVFRQVADDVGEVSFLGYETLSSEATVKAIIKGEDSVEEASEGEAVEVVLDATPFYGESGGQVGDKGTLSNDNVTVEVDDTQIPVEGLIVHTSTVSRGRLGVGDSVTAQVDAGRRAAIVRNHSGTHLLNLALRQVLGDHVKQAGSLVDPSRLRFDFAHFSRITEREMERIEAIVNELVQANHPVEISYMVLEEALATGAQAVFGEKYPEHDVRMVQMGDSRELCGGTHAGATGEIGLLKLTHEGSVAAGVRRIEALTGQGAYGYVKREEGELAAVQELLKAQPFEVADKVKRLAERVKELERELKRLQERIAVGTTLDMAEEVTEVDGVKVLAIKVDDLDIPAMRTFVDTGKARLKSGVLVVGGIVDEKASLIAGVTDDLTDRIHAGEIAKAVAARVGGSGGGRADMAQAGGKDVAKLQEAIDAVPSIVREQLAS
ncbi:alanine--tRNA ligase [Nitrospinae bacterium AH_259_B05_G02_I21]|nr:alanine--tRNA ligase [Nitrospinae bacterium AH_259_B05_G02_I21]